MYPHLVSLQSPKWGFTDHQDEWPAGWLVSDVASVNVIDIPPPASLLLGARLGNYPIRLFTDYN